MGEIGKEKTDHFSVVLDMNCFRLSEMSVKLLDGSIVVVEAKHGERPDKEFGSISRHFLHRYRLPSDIDPRSLMSDLSDKGILTITAKKVEQERRATTSKHTNPEEVLMDDCYDETRFIIDNYEHPQPGIFYTVTRVPGEDSPEGPSEKFSSGCQCTDFQCSEEGKCSCLKTGSNYRRSNDVLLLENDKFGDLPVFECNFQCRCFEGVERFWRENGEPRKKPIVCLNRCVQFGPREDLEIFLTKKKGYGLRTKRKIPSGSFICEYAGEVIGLEEAKNRQSENVARGEMNYIFILNEYFQHLTKTVTCVDPKTIGNVGRYINHSCEANSAVVPVRVNDMTPWLCVFAVRDIKEMEEICFDYSGSRRDEAGNTLQTRKLCFCGARTCRKWLPFQTV